MPSSFDPFRRPFARPSKASPDPANRAQRTGAAACAGLLLVLLLGACRPTPAPRQAVLVLLDAARSSRFSCYGYERQTTPFMDSLADQGVLCPEHYTQGNRTRASLPPLFYSRYFVPNLFPSNPRVPYTSPYDLFLGPDAESISLPKALEEAGFSTALVSTHIWIKPSSELAREFQEAYDLTEVFEVDSVNPYPPAEMALEVALEWARRHKDEDFFLYVHLMDTHFPHAFGPEARAFFPYDDATLERTAQSFDATGEPLDHDAPLSATERAYLDALYDGSLRAVDRDLEQFFDALEEHLPGKPLVGITSDHGEFLLERPGRLEHGDPWYEPVARIPLLLCYPGKLQGGELAGLSGSVDVLPTFLALLDVPTPAGKRFDGVDLSAIAAGERAPVEEAFIRLGLRVGRHKALFHQTDDVLLAPEAPPLEALQAELYDLVDDPLEQRNLWNEEPAIAGRLLARYRERMTPLITRFYGTRGSHTPERPFALGLRFFHETPPTAGLLDEAEVDAWLETGQGWTRYRSTNQIRLLARADAPELELSIAIPNGVYRVSIALHGKLELTLPQAEDESERTRVLSSADEGANSDGNARLRQLDCTAIVVRDETFRATLRADTSSGPLRVGHFGFVPIVDGQPSDTLEGGDQTDILRALGYVDTD